MNIVLTGIFYPLAILRYFEAALRRRTDVNLFTAGPYTSTWIPWDGGMHLPKKYAIEPDFAIPAMGQIPARLPLAAVEKQLPFEPDLWLQIDAGFHLTGRPKAGKMVIVGTDPHVINYDNQRQIADTFYCMQDCYKKDGDEYLPYAYDPIWHVPEPQERKFDACLLGLHYGNRNLLVGELRRYGVNVYYDLGPCYDEARALYNQAPIGLNWSSLHDLTARVFELTAMKRLAVVNRVPDLGQFFKDGIDLIAFDNIDEAVEKVRYYIDHNNEAEAIARRGQETVRPHSWDARIKQIIDDL